MSRRDYYGWLMDIIDGPWKYSRVIIDLWNADFYSSVPMDDNRAADGIELRYLYEREVGGCCDKGGECSVLEMMVALARRIDNEFNYDYELGESASRWFWEMFSNLGLDKFDDFQYESGQVWSIIHNFLERNYGQNGKNCLFPVKNKRNNLEEIEIWWQLNQYILENFD